MADLPPALPLLLATCHGLARLGSQLVGDPLDQRLFSATQWSLHEHGCGPQPAGQQGATEEDEDEVEEQVAAVPIFVKPS